MLSFLVWVLSAQEGFRKRYKVFDEPDPQEVGFSRFGSSGEIKTSWASHISAKSINEPNNKKNIYVCSRQWIIFIPCYDC